MVLCDAGVALLAQAGDGAGELVARAQEALVVGAVARGRSGQQDVAGLEAAVPGIPLCRTCLDDDLTGKDTKAGPGVPTGRVTLPNFKYENYGGQVSGPIIKDRLFFNAGIQYSRNTAVAPAGPPPTTTVS